MAYKRRFSDDDVKRMEQDAAAAGRITAAERQMALAGNSFNNRNNQIADLAAAAHERRLASRSHFVTMNPGAVSPQERASLAQERLTGRERALQEHERGMLKDKIAGEVDVAREKRQGMENQGIAVGKLKYGYMDYDDKYHEGSEERIARQQGQNALSLAEKEWAGKKEIAEIEAKSRKHGIEAEHGSYDENGNYRPGSRVLSERERGEWSVKQQTEANKGTLAQAEVKRQQQEAQIAATLQRAAIQSQGKIDAAKIGAYSKEISAAIAAGAQNGKDTGTVLAELKEAHKDDPGWVATLDSLNGGQQQQGGEKKIKGYRYSTDRKQRIPVYEDGSEGAVEDVKA